MGFVLNLYKESVSKFKKKVFYHITFVNICFFPFQGQLLEIPSITMVTDVTLAFVSIVIPLVVCNIVNSVIFALLPIERYIKAIAVISPARLFCICKTRINGRDRSILIVRDRLVTDESNRNKLKIAACVVYLHFIALVIFVYALFEVEYGCSPITTGRDWVCHGKNTVPVNCTLQPNRVAATCIRYTGNPTFAIGAAYAIFQLLHIATSALAHIYERIELRYGNYCLFLIITLTMASINVIIAALHAAIYPDFEIFHPSFMKYFMISTVMLSTLWIRGVTEKQNVLPGNDAFFDDMTPSLFKKSKGQCDAGVKDDHKRSCGLDFKPSTPLI